MSRFLHTLLRTVQRHKDRSSHRSATTIHDYSRLEKRELFSAAPVDLDPDLIHSDSQPDFDLADADHHSHSPAGWDALSDHGLDVALDLASIDFLESPQQEVTQLVVIDSRVDDINQLVADIENAGRQEIDLLVLNAEEDGVEQITDKLRELSSLSAVHVISHGDSDTVLLGSTVLTSANLSAYAGQIAQWNDSLSTDADLLFYGCNLASTDDGRELLQSLSALCDCDVAASEDVTGHEDQGGDWSFEYAVGTITTKVAVSEELIASWGSTLDITSNLALHNTFDVDASDSSGNNYNGALSNGASIDSTLATNQIGVGKASLDGDDDYIDVSAHVSNFDGISQGTIAAWIYADTATPPQVIFQSSDSGDTDSRVVLLRDTDGSLNFYINEDTTAHLHVQTAAGAIPTGTWTHVAVTVDASGNTLYINGVEQTTGLIYTHGTTATNSFFDDVTQLDFLGWGVDHWGDSNFSNQFNGFIDDARIYDRALTDSDISELAARPFTVTNTNDAGVGSLRQAILNANAHGGIDTIDFSIAGAGVHTIALESELAAITDDVVLDATTQAGGSFTSPLIYLTKSGSFSGGETAAINIRTNDSTVSGFIVGGWGDEGIEIDGSTGFGDNNIIEYNWVGFDAVGAANGVGDDGILVSEDADNNVVRNNVIGSNAGDGIQIRNNSDGNWLWGNIVGLGTDGTTLRGNTGRGVHISGTSTGNVIGTNADSTNDANEGNVISDSTDAGILVYQSNNNTIAGNYIGTDATGLFDRGNTTFGIIVDGSAITQIGGSTAAERNVISGNGQSGISLWGSLVTGTTIQGNYIGLDTTGSNTVGNTDDGIAIGNGAHDNLIGGDSTLGEGNVISGNEDGIELGGVGTDDNQIFGNYIGTDATGTMDLGNIRHGVVVYNGLQGTEIGGTGTGLGNVISGNDDAGIVVDGDGLSTSGNSIVANLIGVQADGTSALGNTSEGIHVFGSADNVVIGGPGAGAGNVIANNDWGIVVETDSTGISILRNSIYDNANLGIDLGDDGETPNDPSDADSGANNLQNWAALTSIAINDAGTMSHDLDTTTLTAGTYTIDFYASTDLNGGQVEGERYLGTLTGVANGNSSLTGTLSSIPLAPGEYVTLVTTDASNNSSEFSNYAVATDGDAGGTTPSDLQATATSEGGLSLNEDGGNDTFLIADDGGSIFNGLTATTMEIRFSSSTPPVDGGDADFITYAAGGAGAGNNDLWYGVWRNDGGAGYQLGLGVDGAYRYATGYDASALFDGNAHTVSVVWNAGIYEFFVDGNSVGSGTGFKSSHTVPGGGELVIGMEQDLVGGGFQPNQVLQATVYDVRIFDAARTSAEISANYRSTLPFDEVGMIANWQFDQLSPDEIVTDAINANNLTVRHTSESGFTFSDPALTLSVDENALDGTLIGTVEGFDAEREAAIASLLSANTNLYYNAETHSFYEYVDTGMDWSTANLNALSASINGVAGHLAVIDSATENQQIVDILNDHSATQAYFAANDATVEAEWRWGTATGSVQFWAGDGNGYNVAERYYNWDPGNPNDLGSNQDYAKIFASTGLWDDVDGTTNHKSIIEYDADQVLDATGNALDYTITSQSVAGAFAINNDTGDIFVLDGTLLDADAQANHTITVEVEDAAGNTQDADFVVSLKNLVEANNAPSDLSSGIELNMDGGNDAYLEAANGSAVFNNLTEVTFETVFQIEKPNTANNAIISYSNGLQHNEFYLTINADGQLWLGIDSIGVGELSSVGRYTELLDGNIHHLAVTWDSTNGEVAFYIDGKLAEPPLTYKQGATIASGGTLQFGQDQDLTGYEANQAFSGTFFDLRIWDLVRSAADIALNHKQKLDVTPAEAAAIGLVANWQMEFNGSNQVVDIVSEPGTPNRLSIGHATGTGFATSDPPEDLHVLESAANGTRVGVVLPQDQDLHNDIVSDGTFTEALPSGSTQLLGSAATFGPWEVESGSVQSLGGWHAPSPLGGVPLELGAGSPGTIKQTLATEVGRTYRVTFALSGDWSAGDHVKDVRVSAAGISEDFQITMPTAWSAATPLWEHRSVSFTAAESSTDLRFTSLDGSPTQTAVISDVQVFEIPQAVNAILNDDSTLKFDPQSGKFYRVSSVTSSGVNINNTVGDEVQGGVLNGVVGNLATIRSAAENYFLRQLLTDAGRSGAWIGASDAAIEGTWTWQDGSNDSFYTGGGAVAGAYENFGTFEPSGGLSENYGELVAVDGTWNDLGGSSFRHWITEWNASEVLASFTFDLTDDANGRFAIDGSTGEITVADTSQLDHETNTSHNVTVQVTDAADNAYSEVMSITIDDAFEISQTVPGAQVTSQDTPLVFTGPNAISVSDGLASANTRLQTYISTNFNGTLTLSQTTGLYIGGGSNGGTFMTIQGTESDINAAFDGMTFTPAAGYSGPVTINMITSMGADLKGRYEFEGDANDTGLGLVQHGALNGATITPDGTRGQVLLLDAAGEHVEVPGRFSQPTNLTLAAWVNLDSGIVDGEVISLGNNVMLRADDSSKGLSILYYQGGGVWNDVSAPGVNLDNAGWNHIAATFDDTNDRIAVYLNGTEVASANTTDSVDWTDDANTTTDTFIGKHGGGSTAFDFQGMIDSARVYDRAISAGEVAALAADLTQVSGSFAISVGDVNDPPTFFAGDGIKTNFATTSDWVSDLLQQGNEKLVSIGTSDDGVTLTRFNEDGSIDASFGTAGRATDTLGGGASVYGGAIQDDGKFLVVGGISNESFIARFTPDGSLDTTFDGDGLFQIDLSATSSEYLQDVLVQPDGKIVAVGYANLSGGFEGMTIVRLNADGTLDTSFDSAGHDVLSVGPDDDRFTSVALDSSNRIVAVGQSRNGAGDSDVAVVRFNTNGSLDSIFDTDGMATFDIGGGGNYDAGTAVAIDTSDRIVIGGVTNPGNSESLAMRLQTGGSLDTTFNGTGYRIISAGTPHEGITDLKLQTDGKVVMVGSAYTPSGINDISVIRLTTNGTLDNAFDGDGLVRQPIGTATDDASAVVIGPNGDIIVAGRTDAATNGFHLTRFEPDGQLDGRWDLENTLDSAPTWMIGDAPVVLDADVKIYDEELSASDDFGGASLTLARNGGANVDDVFSATGDLSFVGGTSGNIDLTPSGVIGTYTNSGGTLAINFAAGTANAQVNEVMQSIAYVNSNGTPTNVQLDWTFDDGNVGAQGGGGAQLASVVSVVSIIDPAEPSTTAPTTATTNEDTAFVYSGSNTISVSDGLAADSFMQVSLSVSNGVLSLASLTGIQVTEGTNGSAALVVEGLESDLNAALDGLTFAPTPNYAGPDTLNIKTSVAANLIGHYTFEGGNSVDQSAGTAQDGTFNGDATTIVDGTRGEVLNLDGSGDYVQISGLMGEPTDITLAAWIDATSTDTSGAVAISLGTSPALYLESDGRLTGFYESGGTNFVYTTTASLLGTGWRHVAVTIDSATQEMTVYVDGASVGTITANLPIEYDNSPDTYIGRAGDGLPGFDFGGSIDDARIFSRALTASEVATLATDAAEIDDSVAITVVAVNDEPVFSNLDANPTYAENSPTPITLDSDVTIFDEELSAADNFSGSTIYIGRSGGASSDDQFVATGLLGPLTESGNAVYNGTTIGTVTQNSGGALIIAFNSNATGPMVNSVLQSIGYSNTDDVPPNSVQLTWTFNDANFGPQGTGGALFDSGTMTVNITPFNDPATVSTNTGITVPEGGSVAITSANLNEGDPDDDGASVVYRVRTDINEGSLFLNGTALEQNDTFTQADIDGGLVSYTHAGGQDTTEVINLAINDVGNAGETNLSIAVSVTPINDAPAAADDPAGTIDLASDPDTVGFWRLGEPSGATAIDAAGSNDGTYNNVALNALGAIVGDTAGDFSGSNSYVNLGNLEVTGTGLTMAAWINADSFGGGDGRIIAKSDGTANLDHTWMLSVVDVGPNVFLRLRVSAGNHTELLITEAPALATGQWYHVAGTYDQATREMAIYVDGNLVELGQHTVGGAVDQDPAREVWIGGNPVGGNFFDGRIDEALIAQRALTAGEVTALADRSPPDYSVGENATLTINAVNGVLHNDSDVEGDTLTVTEVDGVSASVGNQIALGSGALLTLNSDGSFDYDPNNQFESLGVGQSASNTFNYTIADGNGGTDAATATVTINGANDAPTLAAITGDTLLYAEGDGAVVIDQASPATVSDVDSPNFDAGDLQVFFFSGSDPAEDILSVRDQGTGSGQIGVSGSNVTYGGTTIGNLTGGTGGANLQINLNANANAAAVSALLQNVTFENTNVISPTTGNRLVHFRVNDGDGGSSLSYVASVNLNSVNDAPFTGTATTTGNEDATFIPLTLGGSDSDGTIENFVLSSLPANGTLYTDVGRTNAATTGTDIAATGETLTLYFVPNADWNGTTNFNYAAKDDGGLLDPTDATATITVDPVNDAPTIATNNPLNILEGNTGQTITTTLLNEGDVDDDGTEVTYRVTTLPTNGILRLNGTAISVNGTFTQDDIDNNRVTYDHDGSESPSDSFAFDVLDGSEDGATPLTDQTFSISITGSNDTPILLNNNITLQEGGQVTLNSTILSASDNDDVDSGLTFAVSSVSGGHFAYNTNPQATITSFAQGEVTAGIVAFVHDGGEAAPSYDVSVSDGTLSDIGSAAITFSNVNDAPSINSLGGDSVAVPNDGTVVRLDVGSQAHVVDSDSPPNYDGASLSIQGVGFDSFDTLGVDTSGPIDLPSGLSSGGAVVFGGTQVGTIAAGVTNDSIVINFNSAATHAEIETILQSLTFASSSGTLGLRAADVMFVDGDGTVNGGMDASQVATIQIALADAAGGLVTTNEDTTYTFTASDFDFTGITGGGLTSLTVTNLPANGSLELNGSAVSVNDTISRADIDAGNLTFDPDANENGPAYASFDFYLNNGKSTVSVLAGEPNLYTLGGGQLPATDEILASSANFGAGGTVSTGISVVAGSNTIDATYLSQGQIFFSGFLADGTYTGPELAALDTWVQAGGILIATTDDPGFDDVASFYGLTVTGAGNATWNVANGVHPIMNGPFGSVGSSISATGSIGYFTTGSLLPGDTILATDSVNGSPTVVLRAHGGGHILFTSDEGIFRANMTGGGAISTPNDILAANVFAWAVDQIAPYDMDTVNISVSAVNDDPFGTGGLPNDVAATEDMSSDVDLSPINLFDIDSAAGELTFTLSTSAGGTLSATTGGGVSVGGSGSSTLTLDGTLANLNAFIDSPTNIQYLSALDVNGSAADTIQMSVTDNGNVGAGGGGTINLGSVNVNISAVNDTPNVTPASAIYNVNEQTSLSIEGTGFSVSDIDAAGGTMTATLAVGEGTITVTAGNSGVVITGGNSSDTVTVTGSQTQINNLLTGTSTGTITYFNGNDLPSATTTFTVTVNDNGNSGLDPGLTADPASEEASASQTINIIAVNDAPIIDLDADDSAGTPGADFTATYSAGGANVPLVDGSFLDDVDQTLQSLSVQITNNMDGTLEGIGATPPGTIATTYNPATATYTFTDAGGATNADFRSVLDSLTYFNLLTAPDTTTRVITITASDGIDSASATAFVNIIGDTNGPTAVNNTGGSANEGGQSVIDNTELQFTDLQPATQVEYNVTSPTTNGFLALVSNPSVAISSFTQADIDTGSLVYAHDGSETTADSFAFSVDDGLGNVLAGQTFNIAVQPTNDSPINTVPGPQNVAEDGVLLFTASNSNAISIADVDAGTSAVQVTISVGNGTLTLTDTSPLTFTVGDGLADGTMTFSGSITDTNAALDGLSYTPTPDFSGTDTLVVASSDLGNSGLGGTRSDSDSILITIANVNDAPTLTASATGITVNENAAARAFATDTFTDIDSPNLNGGSLTFTVTSTPDASGERLSLTSIGGVATTNGGNVLVGGVNIGTITGLETSGPMRINFNANATPSTAETLLQAFMIRNVSEDPVTGIRTIEVIATDGDGGTSAPVSTDVDFLSTNDAPVSNDDFYATNEDQLLSVTLPANGLLLNDSDAEGHLLTVNTSPVAGPTNGALVISSDGTFSYQPDLNFNGTDSFIYEVTDGNGGTGQATVTVTVAPINDAPVAANDAYAISEDTTLTTTLGVNGLLQNDIDVDGDPLTLNSIPVIGPSHGILVLNADGTFTYTPNPNFNGSDSFTYMLTDPAGDSDTATVDISIAAVNDAPVVTTNTGATVTEGGNVSIGSLELLAVDVDNAPSQLTFSVTTNPAHGQLELANAPGIAITTFTQADLDNDSLVYVHDGSETTSDSFSFQLDDGGLPTVSGTFSIAVLPSNDAPITASEAFSLNEGGTVASAAPGLLANDFDPEFDTLTATLVSGPAHGTLQLNADGSFIYTHDGGESTNDQFVYAVNDGNGGSTQATVLFAIRPVNDAPIGTDDAYITSFGQTLNIGAANGLLANDTDAEGSPLSANLIYGPANGTLTMTPDGAFTYVPDLNFSGTDSFTYEVTDGSSTSSAITVLIDVLPVPPGGGGPGDTGGGDTGGGDGTNPGDGDDDSSDPNEEQDEDNNPNPVGTPSANPTSRDDHEHRGQGVSGELENEEELTLVNLVETNRVQYTSYTSQTDTIARIKTEMQSAIQILTNIDVDLQNYVVDSNIVWENFNKLRHQVEDDIAAQRFAIGSATALGGALSFGYMVWTVRGGFLLASFASSLPAWRLLDPLPVLRITAPASESVKTRKDKSLAELAASTNVFKDSKQS